jgi:predicted esterase
MVMDIDEIEAAISQLAPKDVVELLRWLEEYHAQLWDKQMEDDLESGRLDSFLAEVEAEYESGLSRPL